MHRATQKNALIKKMHSKKKKKMRCKYDLKSLLHVLNHSSSRNNNNVIKTSLKEKRGYNWMRIYA